MTTSNVAIQNFVELVCQGVNFQDAIACLSTLFPTVFPLVGQKGRKALVSKTGTDGESGKKSIQTHLNGI